MEVIDKYKFILTLSNETELSVDEATELINKIQSKYLEMAINKYKNNGLLSLKMFVEAIKYFKNRR